MKKVVVIFMSIFIMAGSLSAQNISVDYLEGYLDIQEDGEWYELYIGDSLNGDAVIRLEQDSYAELSHRSGSLKLMKPGVYQVSDLLGYAGNRAESGAEGLLAGKMRRFLTETEDTGPSAVGGVRASEAVAEESFFWGEETGQLIDDGLEALRGFDYGTALDHFQEAYDYSIDQTEEWESSFYIGYTYMLQGDYREAMTYLAGIEPDPYQDYYTELFMVKGQILVDTFAYNEAIEWFSRYKAEKAQDAPESAQAVYILQGLSYSGLGEPEKARRSFQRAVEILPGNDASKLAENLKNQQ